MSSGDEETSSLVVNIDTTSINSRFKFKLGDVKRKKKSAKLPKLAIKQRYFTSGRGVNDGNQRDLLQEPSPFVYPKDLEEFAHKVMTRAWRNQLRSEELSLKYNQRHNFRTRQQQDLLNRLYVKEPDTKTRLMMDDVDNEYYSIIAGRPIKEKLDTKEYIRTIREVLKTKILVGYREDDIMLMDEMVRLEQKMIDEIKANFQIYVNTFEEFLYNDHTCSMRLLQESEQASALARFKYEEYRQLSKEYGALRSIVYSTEEKWRNSKLYQRFLYLVSPMSWRKEHDYHYHRDTNVEVSTIFGKYRLDEAEENFSLEDLIHQFLSDCQTQADPKLFFTDPNQLMDVFRFIELQNLNSLLHSEELAVPLENVKEGMSKAEFLFNSEIAFLQESIDKLAGGIAWEEERARYLEELALELVNGEFKDLVVHEDVLNLHVFVEDVYETRIGPNDANLTVADMMTAIETRFRQELINLDQMPSDQVVKLERNCYAEEAHLIKRAEKAARKLMEFERLFEKLNKVFSPSFRRTVKELKWRSPPYNPPKPRPPSPRSLTVEEAQFLTFFTDYCKHTDDLKDYGIDITGKAKGRSAEKETPQKDALRIENKSK